MIEIVPPTIDELTIADDPQVWSAAGFRVDGGICQLGCVRLKLAGEDAGKGLTAWSLRDVARDDLDGLRTTISARPPAGEPAIHPNGITAIDHVVAVSPVLERTIASLLRAGLDLRRVRDKPTPAGAPRQAFFRLGEVILEVLQEPGEVTTKAGGVDRPAFFWGVALIAPDLEATVAKLGEHCSEVRDAVQPGRRIATLKRSAGLGLSVALMTPPKYAQART